MPRDDPPPAPRLLSAPKLRQASRPASPAAAETFATALPNPRHEAFCQHFVLLGNAAYAAVDAGYARPSSRNQGYRLMRRPAIRARIAEIRRVLGRAYCLDAEVLLGKLEAIYQRANENHFFHAAARAVELQARIAGHVLPRKAAASLIETTNDDAPAPAGARNLGQSTPWPAGHPQK